MRDFFLRTTKTEGQASLYVYARRRTPSISFTVNTKIVVDIAKWYEAKGSAKKWNEWIVAESKTYQRMREIDEAVDNLLSLKVSEKKYYDEAVDNIVFKELRDAERERQEAFLKAEQERKEAEIQAAKEEQENPITFLSKTVEGMKNGTVRNGGERYTINSCKAWNSFLKLLTAFYGKYPFRFNLIDESTVDSFLAFMENNDYLPKTINKYLVCFRAICQRAADKGIMEESRLRCFSKKKKKITADVMAAEIYLSVAELQALYEMELTGLRAIVRDVFLTGCYTAQRFSDYSRLEAENFSTTAKGNMVVKLIQQKTGNSVVIPILNNNLLEIAKRYNYEIPQVSDVILNRYIKEILKDLSVTVPSLAKKEVTLLNIREKRMEADGKVLYERDRKGRVIKPRYDLVSSHTARRSGITNLYLTRRYDNFQMMSISGHRDLETFLSYVKLSGEEVADVIAEKQKEADNNNLF